MSYKNNQQMALVKKAKVTYLVETLFPSILKVWNKVKSMFSALIEAVREQFAKQRPDYIELTSRQTSPLTISPTHAEPSRTVFLPIQRFRGRR